MKPFIIAEFGSSPAPQWDFPVWCAAVKLAGADAVKVQLFRAEHFRRTGRIGVDGIWYDISDDKEVETKRPLEFPRRRWFDFVEVAHSMGLSAGASVFDEDAVDLVARDGDFIKLAAREQENRYLTNLVLSKHKPVYRSVSSKNRTRYVASGLTCLWTIPEYPTNLSKALLFVWQRRRNFKGGWGWSSHTRSIWDAVFATKLGAAVIEKHFVLDKDNVEAGWSLLPKQFARMVQLCQ